MPVLLPSREAGYQFCGTVTLVKIKEGKFQSSIVTQRLSFAFREMVPSNFCATATGSVKNWKTYNMPQALKFQR
jgi:hypothetical protein